MSECHDQHEMLGGAIARRRLLAAGVARYRYHVVLGKKNTTVMRKASPIPSVQVCL